MISLLPGVSTCVCVHTDNFLIFLYIYLYCPLNDTYACLGVYGRCKSVMKTNFGCPQHCIWLFEQLNFSHQSVQRLNDSCLFHVNGGADPVQSLFTTSTTEMLLCVSGGQCRLLPSVMPLM